MAKRLDAEKLAAAAERYFAACDESCERTLLKNGGISYRQIPYTLSGLSEATGLGREELLHLASSGRSRVRETLGGALRRIERYLVERMLLGEVSASAASLMLRDFGYGLEPAAPDGKRVVIVMDDRERWGD